MLWPGTPSDHIQIIDVRDLANFTIDCLERKVMGIYNTVTPAGSFTMGELLEDSLAVTAANTRAVWVSSDFIRKHNVGDVGALPIWEAPDGEYAGLAMVNGERAVAAGLKNRPTRETARDTIEAWKLLPAERTEKLRAGLSREKEADFLELWNSEKA
jgi:2'-hydroxyisoflavone reductase